MGSVSELSPWSTDRSCSYSWSGSTSQHSWRANWTHSSTDIGNYRCWFISVYPATGIMRQRFDVMCLFKQPSVQIFYNRLRNSRGWWIPFFFFVFIQYFRPVWSQIVGHTFSVISLKFYKYLLLGFITLFLSFIFTVPYTNIDILRNSPLRRAHNVFVVMQSGIMRIQFSILFVHKLIRKAQGRIQSLSCKPENTVY